MAFSLSFWNLALLLGAAQAFFLSGFLFFHARNRAANRSLAAFLLLSGLLIASSEIVRQLHDVWPHLIASTFTLTFLLGPLVFLYVKRLQAGVQLRFHFIHFLPFVISTAYLLPFYAQSGKEKIIFFQQVNREGLPLDFMLLWGMQCLHVIFYFAAIHQTLKAHAANIKNSSSQIEKIGLAWLRRLALANAGVWLFYLASFMLYVFKIAVDPFGVSDYVFGYARSALVYAIGYMGLKQPEIFSGGESNASAKSNGKKYERSGLTPELAEGYLTKLQHLMETAKPFKNAELTLPELAASLDISPNHLSQIINDKFGQNFFDFINSFRVKEAEQALRAPSNIHLTILAIAYDAGFNSKSAFNSAFKKHAKMTPSQYRKLSHPTG